LQEALSWLARACGRRLTTPDRLVRALGGRPRMRWRAELLLAPEDVGQGAQSILELRYLRRVERVHGLPRGVRQRARSPPGGLSIEQVVRGRMVHALFQPIVHLDSGDVVGYEALARGPAGTPFERPGPMFGAAEAAGLSWELDLVAHAAAFRAAVEAQLHSS